MASIPFAVPPSVVDVPGKTARMQRRLDIDPEIGPAATASYSAPLLTVAFAAAPSSREAYITGVIFRAVFLGEVQGVDAQYNNEVEDPRSIGGVAVSPSVEFDEASGCNVGSRLYDPTGARGWACLRPTLSEALWTKLARASEPMFVTRPSDFAAGVFARLGRSLQPAQYTQAKTLSITPVAPTQRNAIVNAERTQILFQEDTDIQFLSLASGTVTAPTLVGTPSNGSANPFFRFKFLDAGYFISRRSLNIITLFRLNANGATSIINYSTGVGNFNRSISVTFDRKYVVFGESTGGSAIYSIKVVGLTSFTVTPSLVAASGPFSIKLQPLSCIECTEGPPSLVFVGYGGVGTSAPYLYYLRLDDATGAIVGASVTTVSAYTGADVYSMKTTSTGYLLVLETTNLHVLRYSNSGATISVTQAATAAHGMTMVLSGSGNTIDGTINTDAIAMSDDCTQIVAVSNQVGQFAVFSFDPATDALALVAQPSLPAAITGAAHQSVHYMKDCASLVVVSRLNSATVLF